MKMKKKPWHPVPLDEPVPVIPPTRMRSSRVLGPVLLGLVMLIVTCGGFWSMTRRLDLLVYTAADLRESQQVIIDRQVAALQWQQQHATQVKTSPAAATPPAAPTSTGGESRTCFDEKTWQPKACR